MTADGWGEAIAADKDEGELLLWQRVELYTCTPGSEAAPSEEGRPRAPRAPAGAGARVYSPSMGGYEGAILLLLVPPAAKGRPRARCACLCSSENTAQTCNTKPPEVILRPGARARARAGACRGEGALLPAVPALLLSKTRP